MQSACRRSSDTECVIFAVGPSKWRDAVLCSVSSFSSFSLGLTKCVTSNRQATVSSYIVRLISQLPGQAE